MDRLSVFAYLLAVALLFAKYFVVTAVQAKVRFAARAFRWPEDAAKWRGTVSTGGEDERVERAQAVLRNDSETQPFFYALAAAWVATGAPGKLALIALPGYALARCAHAWFFLRPRQPARNRAFVVAQLLLFALLADSLRRAL